jgi:hypothetical protein
VAAKPRLETRADPPAAKMAQRPICEAENVPCYKGSCTMTWFESEAWVDVHHIEHWVDGGETKLSNLVTICGRHHVYLHEHGFSVSPGGLPGQFDFWDARGRRVSAAPAPPQLDLDWPVLRERCSNDDRVSAETTLPLWDGEPVDYEACALSLVPD